LKLTIDTSDSKFATGGPPEPVLDFETRAQRVDELGRPLFNIRLFNISTSGHEALMVKVAGEPKGLGDYTPVRVVGLTATTWDMNDRHGVSFKADAIEAANKSAA
jgi:hypothetical protein